MKLIKLTETHYIVVYKSNVGNSDWHIKTTPKMIADSYIQSIQPNEWEVEFDEQGKLKLKDNLLS